MTGPAPWRDALRRRPSQVSAPAARSTELPPPKAISPALAALEAERAALTARMAALTGGADATADPRYLAASIAERRAEFERWAAARDRQTAARLERLRSLRDVPAEDVPGAPPRAAARPAAPEGWPEPRATAEAALWLARRLQPAPEPAPPALRPTAADREGRHAEPRERPATTPDERLERLLDKAPNRARRALDRASAGITATKDALHHARRAIPEDWRRRAEARIPVLAEVDRHVGRAQEMLDVATGGLEALEQRAERLREVARIRREVTGRDAARDEARRHRAADNRRRRRAEEDR